MRRPGLNPVGLPFAARPARSSVKLTTPARTKRFSSRRQQAPPREQRMSHDDLDSSGAVGAEKIELINEMKMKFGLRIIGHR